MHTSNRNDHSLSSSNKANKCNNKSQIWTNMKLVVVGGGPLFLLACLWMSGIVLAAKHPASHNQTSIQPQQDDDDDSDPRPKTSKFGLPSASVDAPTGLHDFSHSNPQFQANRGALHFTQIASETDSEKSNNPLVAVQHALDDGENLVTNGINDQFGFQVPTKIVEGHDEDQALELINMAATILKDLIATPRHQSRLPLGIMSSSSSRFANRMGKHGESSDESTSRGINSSAQIDAAQTQRSLLELVELLTKLGLDETNLQDSAFEQLLERIRMHIVAFRARPILRT